MNRTDCELLEIWPMGSHQIGAAAVMQIFSFIYKITPCCSAADSSDQHNLTETQQTAQLSVTQWFLLLLVNYLPPNPH